MSKGKALILFILLAVCRQSSADIYVLTDADGNQSFSDSPTDPRYVLFMRTGKLEAPASKHAIPKKYASSIERAAKNSLIDPLLLSAVIAAESNYDTRAVSRKGAQGLMQLMPDTARRYGVIDPFDPEQNVMAGARYLQSLLVKYDQKLPLALAAYNAGETSVSRHKNSVPSYPETTAYVRKVISIYKGDAN